MTDPFGSGPSAWTVRGETFHSIADPPAATAGLMLTGLMLDSTGRRQYHTGALVRFLAATMDGADERDRWLAWCHTPGLDVPDRTLADVQWWLVERATGRSYGQARTLAAVAVGDWRWLRGRMLLAGGQPDRLTLSGLCDIAWAELVGDLEQRGASRGDAVARVNDFVLRSWADRETWGTSTAVEPPSATMGQPQRQERR